MKNTVPPNITAFAWLIELAQKLLKCRGGGQQQKVTKMANYEYECTKCGKRFTV